MYTRLCWRRHLGFFFSLSLGSCPRWAWKPDVKRRIELHLKRSQGKIKVSPFPRRGLSCAGSTEERRRSPIKRRSASAARRPSNILEWEWQDKRPQFSLVLKFWRLAPQEFRHVQRVHDVRCMKATASCRPQIWKSKATAQEDPCRSTQRTGRQTVRSTTQRINFKDTTYLCVLASSVWRWHDTWSTRTAIRKKEKRKTRSKCTVVDRKKKLASVRHCSNQLRPCTARGRASGTPWARSSRRSVPIKSIMICHDRRLRRGDQKSSRRHFGFWTAGRSLSDLRRCIDEDYLGSTERKGWLARLTAGFRLKIGGDVVALAK